MEFRTSAQTQELSTKSSELQARNTPAAIERVSADLKVIKAENAKLAATASAG